MDIGFIGLGKMGFPMARRLIEAGHSSSCSTSARRPSTNWSRSAP